MFLHYFGDFNLFVALLTLIQNSAISRLGLFGLYLSLDLTSSVTFYLR